MTFNFLGFNLIISEINMLIKSLSIKSLILIFSFIGPILLFITTYKFGLGLSPDSVEYIAVSKNLLEGRGFLSFDGLPVVNWPPLYPVLLSFITFSFGIEAETSALIVNLVLFGLTIYSFGQLCKKYLNSELLIVIGLISVLFSIPVFTVSLWAWSELIFILFIIWYINSLISFIEKKSKSSLIVLILITSLAMLTRYIGVAFYFVTIVIMIFYHNDERNRKFKSIALYSVTAFIPIALWLIRNYIVSQTLTGARGTSRFSIYSNLTLTIEHLLEWYIPEFMASIKIAFIVSLIFISILLWMIYHQRINFKDFNLKIDKKTFLMLVLITLAYIVSLIIISTLKAHNPIDSRLLSPVFIPVTLILLIILQAVYNRLFVFKQKKILRILLFALVAVYTIHPISVVSEMMIKHHNTGSGYSGTGWEKEKKQAWLSYLNANFIKGSKVYSDDPYEVYYLLNIDTQWSPNKKFTDSEEIVTYLQDLYMTWPSEGKAYLIWFNNLEFHKRELFTPSELSQIAEIVLIDSSAIGELYKAIIKEHL